MNLSWQVKRKILKKNEGVTRIRIELCRISQLFCEEFIFKFTFEEFLDYRR